ncbi:alpha/beta fold hydrolase [Dyella sp. C11]|uniref:alpha/beta hydrolase n=1 Tax=Dyella sp. C11 TaxID=2126991 RepID=UPI0013001EF2|nr:alpha/beta fold hydrolase [Dyella sp. C11]
MQRKRVIWLCIMVLLNGCTRYVAHKIEHPGADNSALQAYMRGNLREQGFSYEWMRTADGVRLAYWLGEPGNYAITETFRYAADGQGYRWQMELPEKKPLGVAPGTRGTVVLLHPWEGEGAMLIAWAYHFASSGYVVVMPDLRSQGESDKAPVGYGPREGRDVAELVENLRAAHRLPEPLFLLGVSYGGAAAMFAAAELRDVRGVIALEPYGNAADVIRRAPSTGLFGPRWLGAVIGKSHVDAAIHQASLDLGVDLEHIDTARALQSAPCTLIVRGANDSLVSAESLHALVEGVPAAHYVEVEHENHISLVLRTDRLLPPLLAWMANLTATPGVSCPTITPLPAMRAATSGHAQGITGGT